MVVGISQRKVEVALAVDRQIIRARWLPNGSTGYPLLYSSDIEY